MSRFLAGPVLPRLLVLLASAWLAFWACAPPSTLPAPVPMAKGEGVALGGGAVGGVAWERCEGPEAERGNCLPETVPTVDLQHWGMGALSDQWALGWTIGGGVGTPGIAGGGMVRFDALATKRALLGPQLEGGFAWWAVGLPMALEVKDGLWLTAHPSYGARAMASLRLPVGLGIALGERSRLDLEAGVGRSVPAPGLGSLVLIQPHRAWIGVGFTGTVGGR